MVSRLGLRAYVPGFIWAFLEEALCNAEGGPA